jgi:hypothetical protein
VKVCKSGNMANAMKNCRALQKTPKICKKCRIRPLERSSLCDIIARIIPRRKVASSHRFGLLLQRSSSVVIVRCCGCRRPKRRRPEAFGGGCCRCRRRCHAMDTADPVHYAAVGTQSQAQVRSVGQETTAVGIPQRRAQM